jgi:hypothetical protein
VLLCHAAGGLRAVARLWLVSLGTPHQGGPGTDRQRDGPLKNFERGQRGEATEIGRLPRRGQIGLDSLRRGDRLLPIRDPDVRQVDIGSAEGRGDKR